jgi:hypothetical protein
MNNARHRRRLATLIGLAVAGSVVAGLWPCFAAEAVPVPVTRWAVILHLEGGPTPELPVDASGLRQATHDVLAALTGAAGILVSDRALTETLVHRHRVRTSGSLTSGFLADVKIELEAPVLLAVSLLVEDGQLLASTRALDTTTGRILGVGVAESALDGGDWQRALVEVLRGAVPEATTTPAPAPALLVLPGRGVGLDQQTARAATNCVLDAALKDGLWMIVDPAIVNAVAAADGRDLRRLDEDGRAALIRHFGTPWAVVPEVVSFGFTAAPPNLRAPEIEWIGSRRTAAEDLVLTLRLVDLRTGLVFGTRAVRATGENEPGWFGLTETRTLLGQLRECANALWPEFNRILEDASS